MSDGKEVKRFIHWFGPDYDGSAQFSQEVVLASDFDRIMSERDELWKRAAKFVMPGEMDTGESIEHYIKTLEQTIATQAKVIEKLKAAIEDVLHERYSDDDVSAAYSDPLMVLLTAIEKEAET